jgi:hypothetical protein
MGEFTCIHTLADAAGPWWQATLSEELTITKVQILNRGDCCGRRLSGTRVFVDDTLCGTITDPPQGGWVDVNCHIKGEKLKI